MSFSRHARAMAWVLPFVLLIGGTLGAFWARSAVREAQETTRVNEFGADAQYVLDSIDGRVQDYLRVVEHVAVFTGTVNPPSQAQFADFVDTTGLLDTSRTSLLFYAERVEPTELRSVIAREQALRSNFLVHARRAASGDDLALMMRVGRGQTIDWLPGIDIGRSPDVRAALQRAADRRSTVLVDLADEMQLIAEQDDALEQYGYSGDDFRTRLLDEFGITENGDLSGLAAVTPVYDDSGHLAGWIFGEALALGSLDQYSSGDLGVSFTISEVDDGLSQTRTTDLAAGRQPDADLVAGRTIVNGLLQIDIEVFGSTAFRPVAVAEGGVIFAISMVLAIGAAGIVYLKLRFAETTGGLATQLTQVEHRAMHDELTGLPNRAALMTHLAERIGGGRKPAAPIWVLFLDMDRLKVINDSLGHSVGDASLLQVAERLLRVAAPHPVARFGGDEFVVVVEDFTHESQAIELAEHVLAALAEPMEIGGQRLQMGASIGLAVADGSEPLSPDDLLRDADSAMYRAKRSGGDTYSVFDESLRQEAVNRLEMEQHLAEAIENREFEAWYQPIVDVDRGEIAALEALVRWRRASGEIESPARFLPVAHETGQIVDIGEQVLNQACRTLAELANLGLFRYPHMAVNVSEGELADVNFIERVDRAIRKTGIPPQNLTLEINEDIMIDRVESSIALMRELERKGVRLSIDDFGTGLSSLSYFKRLSMMSELKIDRSFVIELCTSSADQAVVSAVVAMATSLGIDVVAEGVEEFEQVQKLRELGVNLMQGYYFCRPKPRDEIDELVRSFTLPAEMDEPHDEPDGRHGVDPLLSR
ncbi:MAG: EAL domain-containing protein [Acidimicrobiales bacterium]|nr:EAL domain-containing protein [Acidimicrobiales bacterium]